MVIFILILIIFLLLNITTNFKLSCIYSEIYQEDGL